MPVTEETPTKTNTNKEAKPVKGYGPDGKLYTFKAGTTKEQAAKYFKDKGIIAPGSATKDKSKTGGASGSYTPESGVKTAARTALTEAPNVGGMVGSIMGGGAGPGAVGGAAIGGAVGDAAKQIGMRLLFSEEPPAAKEFTWKIIKDIASEQKDSFKELTGEAARQAALQYGGEKLIGGPLFKLLSKIPHATTESIKVGIKEIRIPLLPGDVKGGVMKYVEQFLTSYLPSSGPMTSFIANQTTKITEAANTIAEGMSKFRGTPEQFGELMQQSVQAARKVALTKLKSQAGSMTKQAYERALDTLTEQFKTGLLGTIAKSKNVETIAGTMITKGVGHEEIRGLVSELTKADRFTTFQAARTAILGDGIKITLTGKPDPAAVKAGTQFVGKEFTQWLNNVGKGRLEVIYTEKQLENIMKFDRIISGVGGQSGFVGKFANLVFVLGRGLSSSMGLTNLAKQSLVTRTMAKIITSEAGIQAYENYVRAIAAQTPRTIKMAVDGLKVQIEKANQEYEFEQQKLEQENKK